MVDLSSSLWDTLPEGNPIIFRSSFFSKPQTEEKKPPGSCPGRRGDDVGTLPELMSRNQSIVQTGWRIFIAHEDNVDVIARFNILAIEGGVLLARSAYWS